MRNSDDARVGGYSNGQKPAPKATPLTMTQAEALRQARATMKKKTEVTQVKVEEQRREQLKRQHEFKFPTR